MEVGRGRRARVVKYSGGGGGSGGGDDDDDDSGDDLRGLNSETLLVVKLNSRVLRVVSRSLFLAMIVVSLPCIGHILKEPSDSYMDVSEFSDESDSIDFESLPLLFQDLVHEGLIKKGDRALILSSGIWDPDYNLGFLTDNEIEIADESELDDWALIENEKFDIAFVSSVRATQLVDPLIKNGGILVVQLSNAFQVIPNYRIVYVRQFNSINVAVRKTETVRTNKLVNSSARKGLCAMAASEAKKAALQGLEHALLEPPRHTSTQQRNNFEKTKFLPDLLGDSLEDYGERIFVNVGLQAEICATMDWFSRNYPKRNQDFVIYNLEMNAGVPTPTNVGISEWLMENVKEEEYVVMKAEAEVVEEMIMRRTICLVDELFLECQNGEKGSGRAYWECLALYGRLRDEGIAVHQWWV